MLLHMLRCHLLTGLQKNFVSCKSSNHFLLHRFCFHDSSASVISCQNTIDFRAVMGKEKNAAWKTSAYIKEVITDDWFLISKICWTLANSFFCCWLLLKDVAEEIHVPVLKKSRAIVERLAHCFFLSTYN